MTTPNTDRPVVRGPVNGNAFAVMAAVRQAIRNHFPNTVDADHLINEYTEKATSGDYHNLLAVSMEYADFDL